MKAKKTKKSDRDHPVGHNGCTVSTIDDILSKRSKRANYVRPMLCATNSDKDDFSKFAAGVVRFGNCLTDKFEEAIMWVERQKDENWTLDKLAEDI